MIPDDLGLKATMESLSSSIKEEGFSLSLFFGQPYVNGIAIPYDLLPWLFRTYGISTPVPLGSSALKYCLHSTGHTLEYTEWPTFGVEEFKKDGVHHAVGGPAIRRKENVSEYYANGKLHRIDGPAIISTNETKIGDAVYALNDNRYDIYGYLENNPSTKLSTVVHYDMVARTESYLDYTLTKIGGHQFLTSKIAESEGSAKLSTANYSPVNFLLSMIYKVPDNHTVIDYKPPNKKFEYIYDHLTKIEDYNFTQTRTDIDSPVHTKIVGTYKGTRVEIEHTKGHKTLTVGVYNTYDDNRTVEISQRFEVNLNAEVDNLSDDLNTFEQPAEWQLVDEWNVKTPVVELSFNVDMFDALNKLNQEQETRSLYGVEIPIEHYKTAKYNGADNSYCWYNEFGEYHSPAADLPAVIFPNGKMFFYKNGNLHRESGPAIQKLYEREANEWYLWGRKVTEEEFNHYNPSNYTIEFRDNSGRFHRDYGPALIEFNAGGTVEKWMNHGNFQVSVTNSSTKISHTSHGEVREKESVTTYPVTPKKPKVVKVMPKIEAPVTSSGYQFQELTKSDIEALKAIFRDQLPQLRKYEKEIHEAADKARAKRAAKVQVNLNQAGFGYGNTAPAPTPAPEPYVKDVKEEQKMEDDVATRKKVRSAPDLEGGRVDQIKSGFVFGLKKGVVNNTSNLVAEKIINATPLEGNEWAERFMQVALLFGLAELLERMPEVVAEKVRLDEEMRKNLASLFRYLSGENVGRDLVDIAANVLPLFGEVLARFTAEEFADLSQDFEKTEEGDDSQAERDAYSLEQQNVTLSDDLFSSVTEQVGVDQKAEQAVYEEVGVK